MSLTDSQNKAISFVHGNALINAGAGSGKSTVLLARMAKLIADEEALPNEILGLTFTNEAAENMRKRLKKYIGTKRAKQVALTTFHSFAYRILKSHYPNEYLNKKIMQPWWKTQTLYDIIGKKSVKNPSGMDLNIKVGDLAGFISYQKANMILPDMNVLIDDRVSYVKDINRNVLQEAYETYCTLVKNARVLDFDDMLVDFYYKLVKNEKLVDELQEKYKFIMCDEYQDTNSTNREILKILEDNNLFVVGDFRQGIYGFINATIDNILEFQQEFDNVTLIELSENFRSTNEVVKISNDLISASPISQYKGFSGQIAARGVITPPVTLTMYRDDYTESQDIISKVEIEMEDNSKLSYSDFCVLCRTNAELGVYESAFADRNIPVNVSTSRSYFDRKEIADLLAYAEHTLSPEDDMSLRRIINAPSRFVSKAVINSLDEYAYEHNTSLENAIRELDVGRSRGMLLSMLDTFEDFRDQAEEMNASTFLRYIFNKLNYAEFMYKKASSHTESMLRQESVEKLFEMAKKFTDIHKFLGHVSVIQSNNKSNSDSVNLMTVHACKGLEFDTVFVPTVTNKNYPHEMNNDIEEERRILYVALSRAIRKLYISLPRQEGKNILIPSPFLMDICEDKVREIDYNVAKGVEMSSTDY